MHALIDAFTDAFNEEETMPERMMKAASKPPQPPKPSSDKPKGDGGPPQLGSILQLVKETGKTRKECKAALISSGNDYDAARWSLMPEPPPTLLIRLKEATKWRRHWWPCAGGRAGPL